MELAGNLAQDSGFICQKAQGFDFDACIIGVVNCVCPCAAGEFGYRANPLAGREGGIVFSAFRGAGSRRLARSYDCALPPRSHSERALAVRARATGSDLSAGRVDSGDWSARKARQMVTLWVHPKSYDRLIPMVFRYFLPSDFVSLAREHYNRLLTCLSHSPDSIRRFPGL